MVSTSSVQDGLLLLLSFCRYLHSRSQVQRKWTPRRLSPAYPLAPVQIRVLPRSHSSSPVACTQTEKVVIVNRLEKWESGKNWCVERATMDGLTCSACNQLATFIQQYLLCWKEFVGKSSNSCCLCIYIRKVLTWAEHLRRRLVLLGDPVSQVHSSCMSFAWQPIWDAILKFDPNVFIWLGDNIYADSQHPRKIAGKERNMGPWKNTPRFYQVTAEEMQQKYNIMKNVSGYVELRKLTEVLRTSSPVSMSGCRFHLLLILSNACIVGRKSDFNCVYFAGDRDLGWSWLWLKWCWQGVEQ